MLRRKLCFALLALAVLFPTRATADEEVTNVVVGDWKSGRGSVNSITIQGEDIYLDGVLQKEKYKPGMDVVIRDGKAMLVPHDQEKDARKAADKAAAKQARDAEKAALKAQAKSEKEALKAQLKPVKEALKREALQGVEKGQIKTSTGTVVNKGGTVRIGDKVYESTGPGTEADIPPETRKLMDDAKKLAQ